MPDTLPLPLRVRGLHKAYGDVVAVAGLDLEVRPGECLGLLGPNGAGKTTTIEICEGLTDPDAGEVELFGLRWGRDDAALRERIGISLQETQLSDKLSVGETLALFRSFYRAPRDAATVLAEVGLEEKTRARVGGLSGGQKQRLAVACALVGDPELLFLDEPTTGLDPQSRRSLWEVVDRFKRAGRAVVLTTHYMDEAEKLSDRIAVVDHGRVIARGTPRELIASLGADHIVEFTAGGPPVGDDVLRALPGVTAVRHEAQVTVLVVTQLHDAVPALMALLERERRPLEALRTHSATLEDVFVSLTGRHLRDG